MNTEERFLANERSPVGDYDMVAMDPERVQKLRARLEITRPMTVTWDWDYVSEVESLRALYERGKSHQWDAETDIDWSIPVPDDEWVVKSAGTLIGPILRMMGRSEAEQMRAVKDELAYGLSQLLHGEQAALLLTSQIALMAPKIDHRLFSGQQVADECRHVEVVSKLLARKFGVVYPIDPVTKFLLDELIEAQQWYRKVVGMQLLFEGLAMAILTDIGTNTNNPLIRSILRNMARDEARHAAFGVLAIREVLDGLTPEERDDLETWTWKLVEVVSNGLMGGTIDVLAERHDVNLEAMREMVFHTPEFWDGRYNLLNHTVMPNLKRIGLITDLTRGHYDRFGLLEPKARHGSRPIPDVIS